MESDLTKCNDLHVWDALRKGLGGRLSDVALSFEDAASAELHKRKMGITLRPSDGLRAMQIITFRQKQKPVLPDAFKGVQIVTFCH